MPTVIKLDGEYFVERSTGFITLEYLDENDDPVTPKTGTWTWTDENGTVINGREDVAISGLSTSNTIILSGDDLALTAGFVGISEKRFFMFEGTYDSNLGNDLPLRDQLEIPVYSLAAIKS